MNDQFLYELRRPPPPEFARRLKRQLDQQASRPTNRFSWTRTLLTLLLIGGSGLAGAYLAMNSRFNVDNDEPSTSQVAATEQGPVQSSLQTRGSRTAATGEAAAGAGAHSAARRNDSRADAQSSATQSSTPSNDAQSYGGAIRDGSVIGPSGSSRELAGPRLMVVTSYLAHSLTKTVTDAFSRSMHVKPAVETRTEEAPAAFRTLCPKTAGQPVDVVVTSRRITDVEREKCREHGVPELLEFKIGYQVVVLTAGTTGTPIKLAARSIHLALARQIPDPVEPARWVDNFNQTWDQIDPSAEPRSIEVLGPAPGTPLRRSLEIIVLGAGCDTYPGIQALLESDPERYAEICYSVRADGLYQEVAQTATMVSQNLWADPNAIAVVDYVFYRAQRAQLAGSVLADVEPTDATLADGTYPLARPVYVYANVERARADRVSARLFFEFVERASTPWGYLPRAGLTPISEQERKAQYERQQIPLRGSWTGP